MSHGFIQADATRLPFADGTFDLVFTSPPYCDARTYGIGAQRHCVEWVDWMLGVVTELTRVCRGLVLVNCAGVTRKRVYQPAPEGLAWEWYRRGGNLWRPAYWHRIGIPGSGGKHWLRADIEYVLCFKRDAEWPEWSDNTACGHTPKWAPGGEMAHRLSNGTRVNQWGPVGGPRGGGGRRTDGTSKPSKLKANAGNGYPSHQINQWGHSFATGGTGGSIDAVTCTAPRPIHQRQVVTNPNKARNSIASTFYSEPVKANPGNLVKVIVGGGVMGHPLAHENEAPFPEKLAEFFIKSFCKPGGLVLDPFSGSGTTVATAARLGRRGIGCDLRMSQCELGRRRLNNPVMRRERKEKPRQLDQFLFDVKPFDSGGDYPNQAEAERAAEKHREEGAK